MKKSASRFSGLLMVLAVLVPAFCIGASAEDGTSGNAVIRLIETVYSWFADTFRVVFTYIGNVVPELTTAQAWVRYAVLGAVLVLLLFFVIHLILGIFKLRFFRRLARILLWVFLLGCASIATLAVRSGKGVLINSVDALSDYIRTVFLVNLPETYGMMTKWKVLTEDPKWVFPAILAAFVLVVILLLHLVIGISRRIEKKRRFKKAKLSEAPEETITVETPSGEETVLPEVAEAPAAETAPEAVEEAAEEVTEKDQPTAEEALEEATEEAVEEVAKEATEEIAEKAVEEPVAAPAEEEPHAPAFPRLAEPVFMPVPTVVSDAIDFTEPKRDGYELKPGISAAETANWMTDSQAEDLTAVVYKRAIGETAEISLDCLNANFKPYAYIDAKILCRLGLVPATTAKIRVTAGSAVEKPLMIEASEISSEAVKMVTLAGGRIIRVM